MVHVWPEFAFSGTHGRVPAMVGILMAHVGREFAGSCSFLPHVCRREACPVHFCPQFTGPPRTGGRCVPPRRPPVLTWPEFRAGVQTRGRSVPAPIASVLVWPEFTPPLQTRGRSVPGYNAARTREGRVYGPPANSRQECTGVLNAAKRGSSNHGGFTAGAGRARRSWPRLSIQWGKAPARRPRRRRCRIICCDV